VVDDVDHRLQHRGDCKDAPPGAAQPRGAHAAGLLWIDFALNWERKGLLQQFDLLQYLFSRARTYTYLEGAGRTDADPAGQADGEERRAICPGRKSAE
jgi:hypothetical protein